MRLDDISRWTAARWYRPLLSLHCWNNYKQGNHLPGGSKSICCCCCLYIYCYYHYHTITATCTSIFGFCLTGLYFVKSLQVKPVPKDLQKNLGDCYRTFFQARPPAITVLPTCVTVPILVILHQTNFSKTERLSMTFARKERY